MTTKEELQHKAEVAAYWINHDCPEYGAMCIKKADGTWMCNVDDDGITTMHRVSLKWLAKTYDELNRLYPDNIACIERILSREESLR